MSKPTSQILYFSPDLGSAAAHPHSTISTSQTILLSFLQIMVGGTLFPPSI